MSGVSLLPCPWCGADGITERRANGWIARCAARFENCAINGRTHHCGTETAAIAAWNCRTPDAASPMLYTALEAALEELKACELDATGEDYNNLQINAALAAARGEAS